MTKHRPASAPRARKAARAKPASRGGADEQMRWLLHELQVHSEEITVQNEQLRKAQGEIEEARDRYAELYEFAPVGYLTLDAHGMVHDCNHAACRLLGRPRARLLKLPLTAAIATSHRQALRDFLARAAQRTDGEAIEVDLRIKVEPERILRVFTNVHVKEGERVFLTAMTEVTVQRNEEEERRMALAQEQSRGRELANEVAARVRDEARIKALIERLVHVQEEERRRLSRDLHDQLGQRFTALRLTLAVVKQKAGLPEQKDHVERAERIAEQLDKDVDHLAWELRPPALDEFGLAPALESFVRQWSEFHRLPVNFACEVHGPRVAREIENHLYRIVQEALNNVIKHSAATEASVRFEQSPQAIRLTVHDNGHGFEPAAQVRRQGLGVVGMRERMSIIGGDLQIQSQPGHGTTVVVRIPLPRPDRK